MGEIDIATAPDVLAAVVAAHTTTNASVIVDFTDVTFVGAAGINALVEARNRLRSTGADLLVRSPPRLLTHMLALAGLTDLIESTRRPRPLTP